jgi:predicted nucleic acid-binding protein
VRPRGLCLDAGALIAIERGVARVLRLLELALEQGEAIDVPAAVIAQVWRGGPRQARLARFLAAPEVSCVALDEVAARAVGELCARTGAVDVVDGHVALHARHQGLAIVTSDVDDLVRFEPDVPFIAV